jgi:hypothetical protein
MAAIIQYIMGGMFISMGGLLYLKPAIMDWLDEQTNLRAMRERGHSLDHNAREARRRGMRLVIPGVMIIIGIGAIISGLT